MSTLPEHIQNAFKNVFRQIPQRILWKFEGEMKDKPNNVLTGNWFPQRDVLCKLYTVLIYLLQYNLKPVRYKFNLKIFEHCNRVPRIIYLCTNKTLLKYHNFIQSPHSTGRHPITCFSVGYIMKKALRK